MTRRNTRVSLSAWASSGTSLLKLGVDDLRLFFENDMRFLEPVPGGERGLIDEAAAEMAQGICHDRRDALKNSRAA